METHYEHSISLSRTKFDQLRYLNTSEVDVGALPVSVSRVMKVINLITAYI